MYIRTLLDQVGDRLKVIHELEDRFSDVLAPKFRFFEYLRNDENGLSRCLADLLDPKGPHGQGAVFLETFLNTIDMVRPHKRIEKPSVELERRTDDGRRIDIVIDSSDFLIGIENKPRAADQDLQLLDYAKFLEAKATCQSDPRDWKLVYLSNREPTEASTGGDFFVPESGKYGANYKWLTYRELEEWLWECAPKCKALSVRVFVEELAKYVKTELNGELGIMAEKEVRDCVLTDAESIRSAVAIYSEWPSICEGLMDKFVTQLKRKAEELGDPPSIRIYPDADLVRGKANTGFDVTFSNRQANKLRFVFNSARHNDFYWGITGREEDGDSELSEKIRSIMETAFGAANDNKWWHWWAYPGENDDLGAEFRNWEVGAAPWVAINEQDIAAQFFEIILKVQNSFKDKMELLEGRST